MGKLSLSKKRALAKVKRKRGEKKSPIVGKDENRNEEN